MKKLVKKYGLRRLVRLNGLSQSGGGRRKGFTLIEILIVMIILGVLAAVVTLSLTGAMGRGEATACQQEYLALRTAVVMYQAEHNMAVPGEARGDAGDLFTGTWSGGEYTPDDDGDELVDDGYIEGVPSSDEKCDWQVDGGGMVYTEESDDCPCYEYGKATHTPTPVPTPE